MTENECSVVQVRLTDNDHKRVAALAASEQVSMSKFVRRLNRQGARGLIGAKRSDTTVAQKALC